MRTPFVVVAAALLLSCSHASPAPTPAKAEARDWIARSNQNAQVLLDVQAQFMPEMAARTGVPGIDERVSDFAPGHRERLREAVRKALAVLEERQKTERDPNVSEDLAIILDQGKRQIQGSELRERLEVPYLNLPRI